MKRSAMTLAVIILLTFQAFAQLPSHSIVYTEAKSPIAAQEILKEMEKGENITYYNQHILGDLDIQRSNLSRDPNYRCLIDSAMKFVNCEFQGNVNFNYGIFNKSINFEDTIFSGKIDLQASRLNAGAFFLNSKFHKAAYFDDAVFLNGSDFRGAEFSETASFVSSVHRLPAYYIGAIFENDAYFGYSQFKEYVTFEDAQFRKSAIFHDATFKRDLKFQSAKFSDTSDFENSVFHGDANFINTEFYKSTDFSNATFMGNASFHLAQFKNPAEFIDTKFKGYADFQDLLFTMPMDFSRTTFEKEARFNGSHFLETTKFINSTFRGNAQFQEARFEAPADFSRANFSGDAWFDSAMFNKVIKFTNAIFKSNASFYDAYIERDARFDPARFESNLNLTEATFYQLMLPWDAIKDRIGKDRTTHLALISNYKTLGWILDRNGCYYQYRELKRIAADSWTAPKILDSISWAYWGYGVRPYNMIFWIAAIIVSFGMLYRELVNRKKGVIKSQAADTATTCSNPDISLYDALRFSALTLASKSPANIQIEGSSVRQIAWFERVVGGFFFVMFLTFLTDEVLSYFKPPT